MLSLQKYPRFTPKKMIMQKRKKKVALQIRKGYRKSGLNFGFVSTW
jgi:hypothetical protein